MTRARLGKKIPPSLSLDVEFELAPGVTALYGRPESGRTLILDLLAGFATPHSGRILVDDAILFDAPARVNVPARLRQCGYIFQRDALFPHLTLRQNLEFAADHLPRLERHRRVAEMLDHFALADAAGLLPRHAAPEVRLQAAAARAVIGLPKLLLIDDCGIQEPLLAQIRAASQSPILLVTRDLDLCCSAAAQLLVLEGGRIAQRGTPLEVLDQPDSVEVARLLGIPNLFPATVAALDPGRNTSRLDFEHFSLTGPYIRGHFRGDRVWVGIGAENLRVHSGAEPAAANWVPAPLLRTADRSRSVRLEFAYGITADVAREEFARQKDNKSWQVEFPPAALRIL
ncbi:MAG TPA: ATP-binding cassette domain-containing protein [Bryobacteraceae bacterium]|nr:ATP-binding cassette domain-containing protein [Bryobacteraceae bacterium]